MGRTVRNVIEPLTLEERRRFAAWLRAEAETDRALSQQLDNLTGMNTRMGTRLARDRRGDAAAMDRIADRIEKTETVTT